jgi:transcriptional repressor NrdR
MRCPFCGTHDTKVIDSRLAADGDQVRRRCECKACRGRFTTLETPTLVLPRIVKSDGRREPFSEDKLRRGMLLALHKRPVSMEAVDQAIHRIKRHLIGSGEREVAARQLGEWMMYELRTLDQVAYVRFASVYRSFQDVNAFREEIERLERSGADDDAQLSLLPLEGAGKQDTRS